MGPDQGCNFHDPWASVFGKKSACTGFKIAMGLLRRQPRDLLADWMDTPTWRSMVEFFIVESDWSLVMWLLGGNGLGGAPVSIYKITWLRDILWIAATVTGRDDLATRLSGIQLASPVTNHSTSQNVVFRAAIRGNADLVSRFAPKCTDPQDALESAISRGAMHGHVSILELGIGTSSAAEWGVCLMLASEHEAAARFCIAHGGDGAVQHALKYGNANVCRKVKSYVSTHG